MKTPTSYSITRGSDGSQCKIVNWQEESPYIGFVNNQVRFYSAYGSVNSHYKVYTPEQGEHLEITGTSDEWDEAEYEDFKVRLLLIGEQ